MEPLNKSNTYLNNLRGRTEIGSYVSPDSYNGSTFTLNTYDSNGGDIAAGFKNPSWKEQVKRVENATTSFTGRSMRVVGKSFVSIDTEFYTGTPFNAGSHRLRRYYGDPIIAGGLGAPGIPSGHSNLTTADNRAIAKLYDKLQSFEGTQSAGEDLGEITQTLRMLSSPMKSLRKAIVDIAEGHSRAFSKKSTKAVAKALADSTLEYKFGVVPLVNSITDVVQGLNNRDYLYYYYPFSCSGRNDDATVTVSYPTVGTSSIIARMQKTVKTETYVRYKGVWKYNASVPKRSVSDILGTRFQDVIPTIYNLIPYSWAIDYVTNLGDIAQSIAVPWANVAWCAKTSRSITTTRFDVLPDKDRNYDAYLKFNGGKWVRWNCSPGYVKYVGRYITRSSQTSLPIPTLEFDARPSLGHMVNLGALLASKLLGIRRSTDSALKSRPTLPQEFSLEMRKRGEKIPYPFHKP